jgi:hypothetical protein
VQYYANVKEEQRYSTDAIKEDARDLKTIALIVRKKISIAMLM